MKTQINSSVGTECDSTGASPPADAEVIYADTFEVIKSMCNERSVVPAWIDTNILSDVQTAGALRFLSVGSGPGDFDETIISYLLARKFERIEYTALEPSELFARRLKERFSSDARVELRIIQKEFQDVVLNEKFDLIIFMHSLYYMKDKRAALEKASTWTNDDGGIMVLVHQASLGVSQLQKHFVRTWALPRNPGMDAETLLDVFDASALAPGCELTFSLVWTEIEMTRVLDPNRAEGEILFRFLLNCSPGEIDPNALSAFRDLVRDSSYRRQGAYRMIQPLGVHVVRRNP